MGLGIQKKTRGGIKGKPRANVGDCNTDDSRREWKTEGASMTTTGESTGKRVKEYLA